MHGHLNVNLNKGLESKVIMKVFKFEITTVYNANDKERHLNKWKKIELFSFFLLRSYFSFRKYQIREISESSNLWIERGIS